MDVDEKDLKKLHDEYLARRADFRKAEEALKEVERAGYRHQIVRQYKKFDYIDAEEILLSAPIVRELISSLVDDLYRIENYHHIEEGIDAAKRAAYLGKWLVKAKPLSYSTPIGPGQMTREHIEVNESFAMQCMLTNVGAPTPPPIIISELRYTLRFRHYNEAKMTMLLRLLGGVDG